MSRITQQSMSRQSVTHLQQALDRFQTLQERVASGKRVERPSDDPVATATSLRHRSDLARRAQYERNIDDASGWLTSADTALTSASSLLNRVQELVLRGKNDGAMSPADRAALADEVDSLREGLLDLANTTYLDRAVFGGTSGASAAYDPSGTFIGDTGVVGRTVGPDTDIEVNLSAPSVFGTGPTSVFATLARVSDDLRTNPAALGTDLDELDAHTTSIHRALGVVGARQSRVDATRARLADEEISLRSRLSEAEDVDLPEAIMQLSVQEVAYQAALAATQRVLQPSLVDFLR
jgi:flagellar hook-associated protein 3 FlgL